MRTTNGRVRGLAMVAAVGVMVLVAAACEPVKLGGPGPAVGNNVDPVACPQHQPVPQAPCGPLPLVWAAMNAPYELYDSGDPYSTKCIQGGGSGTSCTVGNPLYRTSGYSYAIDVTSADVGRTLTLDAYDIGTYQRLVSTSTSSSSAVNYDLSDVVTTAGSTAISSASGLFTSASAGKPVVGAFCAPTCTIATVTSPTTATLKSAATRTGTFSATVGYDCYASKAPFSSLPSSSLHGGNCQTGDVGSPGQNVDIEVFDRGGAGQPAYATPLNGCHFTQSAAQLAESISTHKNRWAALCTFTPSAAGIYAVRVRNSGLPGLSDASSGYNAYALRVRGATSTSLYPLGEHSVYVNASGSTSLIYVADVPAENAGKRLVVDVFDAGDGMGTSNGILQLKAPPGGTTATPTATGIRIPAPGVATSCRYNPTPSVDPEPETANDAPNCAVVTHSGSSNAGIYNGKWLRFEVTLDPAYTCSSDCRWTLQYNWGSYGMPTDRMVFTAKVL